MHNSTSMQHYQTTVQCGAGREGGFDVTFSQCGSGMRHHVSGRWYPSELRNGMYELTMHLHPGFTRPGASA